MTVAYADARGALVATLDAPSMTGHSTPKPTSSPIVAPRMTNPYVFAFRPGLTGLSLVTR